MNIQLFRASSFNPLFEKLRDSLLQKKMNIHDIFCAPIVFTNNNFAQNKLEEFLLKENKEAHFVGNIHFLEWSPILTSLLEPYEAYLNPVTFTSLWALFLQEQYQQGKFQEIFSEDKELYLKDFTPLGNYYYTLFKEYEIFAPEIVDSWKQNKSILLEEKEKPWLVQKLQNHKSLYLAFWNWLKPVLSSVFVPTQRESLIYPTPKHRKEQLKNISDIHIFLPQNILLSQLEILKAVLKDKNVSIYILCSQQLQETAKEFYYKENSISLLIKNCAILEIPLDIIALQENQVSNPVLTYISATHEQEEYEILLENIVEDLNINPNHMLNHMALIMPSNPLDKRHFNLVFNPHKENIQYHTLYQQEKIKNHNYFDLLLTVWDFADQECSIEKLEEVLKIPLLKTSLGFLDEEREDLIAYLKSAGAWGENIYFTKENTLYYHLSQVLFNHILDTESKIFSSLNHKLVEYCLDLIWRVKALQMFQSKQVLSISILKDYEVFLEWLLPSIFWKEFDDNYIRKDILDVQDFTNFVYKILNQNNTLSIDNHFYKDMLEQMNKNVFRGDNLSFAKNQGIVVGEIKNIDVYPVHQVFISGFSEQLDIIPKKVFQEESILPYLSSKIELEKILKYQYAQQFLEFIQESKNCLFLYTEKDSTTQEELKPHILTEILNMRQLNNKKTRPIQLKDKNLEEVYTPTTSIGYVIQNMQSILVKKIWKYLQNPLQFTLNQQWGKSTYWEEENEFTYYPYFFSMTGKKKNIEYSLYHQFFNTIRVKNIKKEVLDKGEYGLLRDIDYNTKKLDSEQENLFSFLTAVQQDQAQWGELYHKILIGHYQSKNLQNSYLIVKPPIITGKEILADLYFAYLKLDVQDEIWITLPIFIVKDKKQFPSYQLLLSIFCLALSLKPKGRLYIRILLPSEDKQGYKLQEYRYSISNIEEYFTNLLYVMQQQNQHPFTLEVLEKFYAKGDYKISTTWEENYISKLKDYMQTQNEEMSSILFPVEYNQDLQKILNIHYSFLLQPLYEQKKAGKK